MRLRQGLCALGMLGGLLGAGCEKQQEPPTVPMDVPAVPAPTNTVPRAGAAATPTAQKVVDSAPAQGTGSTGTAQGTGSTQGAGSAGTATGTGSTTATATTDAGSAVAADSAWTLEPAEKKRGEPPSITMRSVRTGTHAGYDRTVFEFEGPRLPGYQVSYVKTPVQDCGSGDDVPVPGKAALQVRFTLAQLHNEQGQATVAQRTFKPALPSVLELARVCAFEGEVTWVLGTTRRAPFRVLELRDPTRLVLDVQH
ncbi:hypothetical protein OV207_03200 [Corallococcus sp. BB11-1]|uniref:AMIN-like domain-containing (lipo)protein n=1 Tax=Corallococcus sp. BB11-1 TaxID=2996783 RepID=UPI00226EC8E5|nr:hypothetical protein [Corallococcus sp. BB11-1]MCY1030450.1 hypothetical protein [Corallococcus sp. BB11-1]